MPGSSLLLGGALSLISALPAPFVPDGLSLREDAPRPNFLVLLVDDMGYADLPTFGSPNHTTPHIDSLVHDGVRLTQWISAASICTPSRAALQTGRYPIRTGCMGNVEKFRVIPEPSNPGGLDPQQHISVARALKQAGYATGMSGKWHLGINGNEKPFSKPDNRFTPTAHGYDSFLGSPYTNAPMCEMDSDGISQLHKTGPSFCFLTANTTVVQQPLKLENFTQMITDHAVGFIDKQGAKVQTALAAGATPQPWYFYMSYFHVHTPLFTNRLNRGRSRGGEFGDNVEELDDSVGELLSALTRNGFDDSTLVFFTSDNGPYQEEGWDKAGRVAIYDEAGAVLGRLKGGKGQLYEGGVRMPGIARWPGVIPAGSVSDTMVSTMDLFPTMLAAAGVDLGADYVVDGRDMLPVLKGDTQESQHEVFLHYCGFNIVAARVFGRFKVFWKTPRWYANDKQDASVCLECCNGVNAFSRLTGSKATLLCGCKDEDMDHHATPIVYDMRHDMMEREALSEERWPQDSDTTWSAVVAAAERERDAMLQDFDPKPNAFGAGTCTAGLSRTWRQPCCPGCHARGFPFPLCYEKGLLGKECSCDAPLEAPRDVDEEPLTEEV